MSTATTQSATRESASTKQVRAPQPQPYMPPVVVSLGSAVRNTGTTTSGQNSDTNGNYWVNG